MAGKLFGSGMEHDWWALECHLTDWIVPRQGPPRMAATCLIMDSQGFIREVGTLEGITPEGLRRLLRRAHQGKRFRLPPARPRRIFCGAPPLIPVLEDLLRGTGVEVVPEVLPRAREVFVRMIEDLHRNHPTPYPPFPLIVGHLSPAEIKSLVRVALELWEREFWLFFAPDRPLYFDFGGKGGYLFPMGHDGTFFGLAYYPSAIEILKIFAVERENLFGKAPLEIVAESFFYEDDPTHLHPVDFLALAEAGLKGPPLPYFRRVDQKLRHYLPELPPRTYLYLLRGLLRIVKEVSRRGGSEVHRLNRTLRYGEGTLFLAYPATGSEHLWKKDPLSPVRVHLLPPGKEEEVYECPSAESLSVFLIKTGLLQEGAFVRLIEAGTDLVLWDEETDLNPPLGDLVDGEYRLVVSPPERTFRLRVEAVHRPSHGEPEDLSGS
ncbi:hypothetical protein [Thermosulfurimonas sp. F29]|uniref:hypothetical protein n=1 Tax=Thermosulfurimonas sp. F29 TaxID=2867247 RepID=UPI001C83D91A|nr:hypothetical protein [Thermosulfurimonas sp. F29]MBX6423645.1 hypothetical protein [Thermosulfurimonas sp. F29]